MNITALLAAAVMLEMISLIAKDNQPVGQSSAQSGDNVATISRLRQK